MTGFLRRATVNPNVPMVILVDYDNVLPADRLRGLSFVVTKLLASIDFNVLPAISRLRVRLYGGWYQGTSLSKAAQALSAQAQALTGAPFGVTRARRSIFPTLTVEMAYSLEVTPQVDFANTYRTREVPTNVKCAAPPYSACANSSQCALSSTHSLFETGVCPGVGCGVKISALLSRAEQKLVDTMLTSDLIHLATRAAVPIAVVSDDDDMWPGITTALAYGATVVHVHTHAGRKTPRHYVATAHGHAYHESSL